MVTAPYRDDLNKIVILNPKGGCGKTTLATNLASYFALRGPPPTLVDTDPRGYSTQWLERRSSDRPRINGITDTDFAMLGRRAWPFRKPRKAGAIIIDTPAFLGLRNGHARLRRIAKLVSLMPLILGLSGDRRSSHRVEYPLGSVSTSVGGGPRSAK